MRGARSLAAAAAAGAGLLRIADPHNATDSNAPEPATTRVRAAELQAFGTTSAVQVSG